MRRGDWVETEQKIIAELEKCRRMRKRAIKAPVAAEVQRKIDKLKTALSKHRRKFSQDSEDQ